LPTASLAALELLVKASGVEPLPHPESNTEVSANLNSVLLISSSLLAPLHRYVPSLVNANDSNDRTVLSRSRKEDWYLTFEIPSFAQFGEQQPLFRARSQCIFPRRRHAKRPIVPPFRQLTDW
jgi:hypothetical protein